MYFENINSSIIRELIDYSVNESFIANNFKFYFKKLSWLWENVKYCTYLHARA